MNVLTCSGTTIRISAVMSVVDCHSVDGNRNYNRNDYSNKGSMNQESFNRIVQELMSRIQGGQISDASNSD